MIQIWALNQIERLHDGMKNRTFLPRLCKGNDCPKISTFEGGRSHAEGIEIEDDGTRRIHPMVKRMRNHGSQH